MRTTDRILALLFGLVGLIGGVLVVVEIVYRGLHDTGYLLVPWTSFSSYLRETSWSAIAVITTGVVLALLGVVLVVAELKPRRPALLVLSSVHPDVTAALPRRAVARLVTAALEDTPGVERTSVSVRARRISVDARTTVRDNTGLSAKLEATAHQSVDGLQLRRTPKLDVTVVSA